MVLIFLLNVFKGISQFDPNSVCRVENGRTYFRIDLRWTNAQRKELTRLFDLDSLVLNAVYSGKRELELKNAQWEMVKLNDHLVELSKVIKSVPVKPTTVNDVFMVDDRWLKVSGEAERVSVEYGVNRFTNVAVFLYRDGVARFFLPGHKEAKRVFLSGSFNAWSTERTPMLVCDSGWMVSLKLKPGKYSYKYIIDGTWANDSFNKLLESDTYNGNNSIVYCYNHIFPARGYPSAHQVILTGSFNGWNENELKMIRINATWMFPLYLREGTHYYKFIVDRKWITDPDNNLKRPDGSGNYNSVIGVGDSIGFRLKGFQDAKSLSSPVILMDGTGELSWMNIRMDGTFWYVLGAGNYEYRFIVDGRWMTDPANPNTHGLR